MTDTTENLNNLKSATESTISIMRDVIRGLAIIDRLSSTPAITKPEQHDLLLFTKAVSVLSDHFSEMFLSDIQHY